MSNNIMHVFVTANTTAGVRQGAVISLKPVMIRGITGAEYLVVGNVRRVVNPPGNCSFCGLPLGLVCVKCEGESRTLTEIRDYSMEGTE